MFESSSPLTCQTCGNAKPEAKVRWRSFDLDLPALRLCTICTHLLGTDPAMLKELGL
jgi:hypothetical protein